MTTSTTICDYSNPVNFAGALPTSTEPFSFASSTCLTIYEPAVASGSASSGVSAYNGFTYGEIVNSVLLFGIFAVVFYALVWFTASKIKIRRLPKN